MMNRGVKEQMAEAQVQLRFADAHIERLTRELRDLRDRVRELEGLAVAEGKAISHSYGGRERIIKAL